VYNKNDLQEILEYLTKKNIFIITDEIYEKLLFDNSIHTSLLELADENQRKNVILINGVSKAFAMTGWRIGYAIAEKDVIDRMKNFVSQTSSNPNTIAMHASVEALIGPQDDVDMMVIEFQNRRNHMIQELDKIPGIKCKKPEGAFYLFVDFSYFIGKTIKGAKIESTIDLSNFLLEKARVATVPGEGFGLSGYIRFSYATSLEMIDSGIKRIQKVLN